MSSEIDLSSIYWRAPEFLEYYGNNLNENLIMDYFSLSPFYDKQCNNELIKMQNITNNVLINNDYISQQLKYFKGLEFVLVKWDSPSLFIINKQFRLNENQVRVLSVYYCLNNNLFMAPNIFNCLTSKISTATSSLTFSLNDFKSNLNKFNPRLGYQWDINYSGQRNNNDSDNDDNNNTIPLIKSLKSTKLNLNDIKSTRLNNYQNIVNDQVNEVNNNSTDINNINKDNSIKAIEPPTKSTATNINDVNKKKKRKSLKSSHNSNSSTPNVTTPATPNN